MRKYRRAFVFPPPNEKLVISEEEQMRRRHSKKLDKGLQSPEPALSTFKTYYAMKGWNHIQTAEQLRKALQELTLFIGSEDFNSMDLHMYQRQWSEEQMPLILDQYKGFLSTLASVRRERSPSPPHNVLFDPYWFTISWESPISRQEEELLMTVRLAQQQLQGIKSTSDAGPSPAMIALNDATKRLHDLRVKKGANLVSCMLFSVFTVIHGSKLLCSMRVFKCFCAGSRCICVAT